jgi:hypothetical protein
MNGPLGLALYIRSFGKRKPADVAAKFARYGLKWVAIGGPWHDASGQRWINTPERVVAAIAAFKSLGIAAHVWGYPWHDVGAFVEQMTACSSSDVAGWLLDPELGQKGRPIEARDLFKRSRASLRRVNPKAQLGMTSYGLPRGHRSFPFEEFAEPGVTNPLLECDYGSPQLYDIPKNRIHEGIKDYSELGFDAIVPSFGCYRFIPADPSKPLTGKNRKAIPKTGPELHEHLSCFVDTNVKVYGMVGWAENFVGADQWAVLARWADWLGRGACALPPLR